MTPIPWSRNAIQFERARLYFLVYTQMWYWFHKYYLERVCVQSLEDLLTNLRSDLIK